LTVKADRHRRLQAGVECREENSTKKQSVKIFGRYPNATPAAKFVGMRRYPKTGAR
jgi:hypothetical protein